MLSNTATPRYYAEFRDDVLAGRIPVCKEIEMEMNRIDDRIRNPGFYYDRDAVEGFIRFAEAEMTLTDGSDLRLLPSFKLWAEEIFGWWFFTERSVYVPNKTTPGGHFEKRRVKQRLINKQYIIVARGGAKSLYETLLQAYFLTIDTSTTHQVTTAPTMKQAEEVMQPFRTAITRAKGPLFDFMTQGSLQNTTGNRALRQKLVPTKKGIENFMTNSLLEVRPMSIDKLQGLRTKMNTVDEWLSGDIREDVVGAIEQGASKVDDWLILAVSSEGTVRNSAGDNMKMELLNILRGEYSDPHTSIFPAPPPPRGGGGGSVDVAEGPTESRCHRLLRDLPARRREGGARARGQERYSGQEVRYSHGGVYVLLHIRGDPAAQSSGLLGHAVLHRRRPLAGR